MGAAAQLADFLAHVHAADAACRHGACIAIEPAQLTLHLKGQFTGGCDDERQRPFSRASDARVAQQGGRDGQSEGHGLARSCLSRDEQVVTFRLAFQNRHLDRGERREPLARKSWRQRRMHIDRQRCGLEVFGGGHGTVTFGINWVSRCASSTHQMACLGRRHMLMRNRSGATLAKQDARHAKAASGAVYSRKSLCARGSPFHKPQNRPYLPKPSPSPGSLQLVEVHLATF